MGAKTFSIENVHARNFKVSLDSDRSRSTGRYLGMGTHIWFLAGKKIIALGTDCVNQERANRNKYSF